MTSESADLPTSAWNAAWEDALSQMEIGVDEAEALLAAGHAPVVQPKVWTPPTGLGPLPTSLAERAQALLHRQAQVGARLARAATSSRRHANVVHDLRAQSPAMPVYLDTEG